MKNKGFSLVELLVAIAIAGIVAGSVGYLLTTSLRMFGNETTDVAQQQELQVTLNQIIDYAMESQTVVIKNSGSATDYLALGTVDSSDRTKLNAEVFFVNDEKLYMCKTPIENYEQVSDVAPRNLDEKVSQIKTDALNASDTLPQYLLAENVTVFFVQLNGTKTVGADNVYDNPLSLDISLEFTKNGSSKEIKKKVSDKAVFRNTLDTKIYSDGVCYGLKKDADALTITTETVKLEERTGDILIPGTSSVPKKSLNILEIVPAYSYDYVQYAVGGYNGKANNSDNTTYGASAPYGPVSAEELEGYLIQTCGKTGNDNITKLSGIFLNDKGPDLKAYLTDDPMDRARERNGYYEYVGHSNGIYAIDSYEVSSTVAPTLGMGDAKPVVISYTQNYDIPEHNPSEKNKYTAKIYSPVFKYCSSDEYPGQYYKAEVDTSGSGSRDYDKEYNDPTNIHAGQHYVYAGKGIGEVALKFTRYNYKKEGNNYNPGDQCCYVVDDSYEIVDVDNGEYYAYISGWDRRDISGASEVSYEKGYDFNQTVDSAIMYSKYYTGNPAAVSKDFGWVWREAEVGTDLYNSIEDETTYTSVGSLVSGAKEAGEEYARGTRLYLKHHCKHRLINNELFKLFTMQGALEQYVDGTPKMLDILNGRWDAVNNKFSEVNDKALKAWEAAGNKITVNVRTPGDVVPGPDGDVANCDMVIIGKNGDGGFNWANQFTSYIRGTTVTEKGFSASNDISFEVATEIYKRVCEEEITIACPFEINDISDGGKELNLSKLYKMVYCVSNYDVSAAMALQETIGKEKQKKIEEQGEDNYWTIDPDYMKDIDGKVMNKGSGRDFFKDFLESMEGEELSKSLYENGTLRDKTTKFISIDRDGNIVIKPQNNTSAQQTNRWGSNETYRFNYGGRVVQNFNFYTDSASTELGMFESLLLLHDPAYGNSYYLMDRYRAAVGGRPDGSRVYDRTAYIRNDEYGYRYRFYFDSKQQGVYKNALLYMSDSNMFNFYKSGAKGMMQLSVANQNSHPMTEIDDPDIIGTVEYVGADDIASGDARKAALSDSSTYTYEDNPTKYAFRLEKLGTGTNKKVFYMSMEDYERAQVEGLYIYVLVKTSKDPSNYNKCVLRYFQNEEDGGAAGRFDYDAYNYDIVNNESSDNVIKYKAGSEANEAYVREYRYHANPEYFQHIYAPNNKGNNFIEARIDAGGGREYEGSDTLYFIIRDEFDLD